MKQRYIPEGWKLIKLKEVLQEKSQRNKNQQVKEVLSITNSQGFVKQEDYFEGTVHSKNIENYKIVRKNQFAYNPSRINVGSIDILKKYEEGVLSPMYIVFETNEEKLSADYFKYYFETNEFMQNVKNNTQGSVRESLNFTSLSEFEYLLPPLKEQKKIASILLNIDIIIQKLKLEIEQRTLQKKWTMQKIFNKEKSVYEIVNNKTWKEYKIRELLELLTDYDANGSFADMAKNVKTYNKEEYAWYVRMTDLENDTPIENVKYVDKESYEFLKKTKLYGNELLIAKRGDIGKVYIFKMKTKYATLGPNTYLLKVNNKVYPQFLYYYFQSQIGQRSLKKINSTTSLGAIYKEDVKNINIKVPTKKEQKEFIKILSNIDKQIELLQQKNKEYQKLKKGLMQQLLTGKVRVKI